METGAVRPPSGDVFRVDRARGHRAGLKLAAGELLNRGAGVRALVRVHPDHDHVHRPFVGLQVGLDGLNHHDGHARIVLNDITRQLAQHDVALQTMVVDGGQQSGWKSSTGTGGPEVRAAETASLSPGSRKLDEVDAAGLRRQVTREAVIPSPPMRVDDAHENVSAETLSLTRGERASHCGSLVVPGIASSAVEPAIASAARLASRR